MAVLGGCLLDPQTSPNSNRSLDFNEHVKYRIEIQIPSKGYSLVKGMRGSLPHGARERAREVFTAQSSEVLGGGVSCERWKHPSLKSVSITPQGSRRVTPLELLAEGKAELFLSQCGPRGILPSPQMIGFC